MYSPIPNVSLTFVVCNPSELTSANNPIAVITPPTTVPMVPYKGSVVDILKQLTGGLRSGLSYCGAHSIEEMQKNAEFIKMSGAGFAESQPHDVSLM